MNINLNMLDILNSIVVSNEDYINLLNKFSSEFIALKGVKFPTQTSIDVNYYNEFKLDEIEESLLEIYKQHLNESRYDIKVNQNIAHTVYIDELLRECNYKTFKTYKISPKNKSAYNKYLESFIMLKNSFYVQTYLVIKNRFGYSKCDKYNSQIILEELNKVLLCLDSYKYIDTMIEKIDLDLGEELKLLENCVNSLINILSKILCVAVKEFNLHTGYNIDINDVLSRDVFKENIFFGIDSLARLARYCEIINSYEYNELREKNYDIVGDFYKQYKKNLGITLKNIKKNPNKIFIKRNYKNEPKEKTFNRVEELIDFKISLAVNVAKFEYLKTDRHIFTERYKGVYEEARKNLVDEYTFFNRVRKFNSFILQNKEPKESEYLTNILSLHDLLRQSLSCSAMGCVDNETKYIIENITSMFKSYIKKLLSEYSKVDLRNILYFNAFNQTILNLNEPLILDEFSDIEEILNRETA